MTPDPPAALGRPFVIVATQRSGSTLLVRSLDASPMVFCAGEIFRTGQHVHHPEYCFPQTLLGSRRLARLADLYLRRTRVERHLRHFYGTAGVGVRAVGFKVMVSQLRQFEAILPTLMHLGTSCIFLCRQDSFATALSYFKAKASGVFHSDRVNEAAASKVVTADAQEFRALLAKCESHRQAVCDLHAKYGGRLITYEELVDDWDGAVSSIGLCLGINHLRLPVMLDKLGPSTADVVVENETDLRRQFAAMRDS